MPTIQKLHRALVIVLIAVIATPLFSREPLSVDQGKTGLLLTLRRLRTTARLMHTAAHPDDEDGGMLTLESRGRGAYVVQMTLTRGEGGQNAVGKELGDELGMLRTLELLEADRYYGADQRFSRVADFGFSRTAEETIQKWNGRQTALADLVRVIRTLHPDVVISRFIGDPSDGHGHHQASGLLTREAFRAAADPTKFPDQIKEGLRPFQAKKLYVRARGDDWNVELDVNQTDPLLGMSYVAWGWQGLKHQLSQGSANWQMPTRMFTSHYKLVDTSLLNYKPGHEKDFFDGIDTTLLAVANVAPNAALLKPGLLELTGYVDEASSLVEKDQKAAAVPLLRGLAKTKELIEQTKNLPITPSEQQELLIELESKRDQFRDAANYALGVTLTASAELSASWQIEDPAAQLWLAARPSQKLLVTGVSNFDLSTPVQLIEPKEWGSRPVAFVGGNKPPYRINTEIPPNAAYTRQYWHREDPDRESVYQIDDPQYATLPLTPWPLALRGTYKYEGLEGEITSTVEVVEPKPHPLIVGPAWSVLVPQSTIVVPAASGKTSSTATWASNLAGTNAPQQVRTEGTLVDGNVRNSSPALPAVPNHTNFNLSVPPGVNQDKRGKQQFDIVSHNSTFDVGYSVVTRDDLGTAYYFRRSNQPVSIVDVKVPDKLRAGYIPGVGDDIPDVLKSIGVNVTIIPPSTLSTTDLTKFDTIVLGIRAYDYQADVRANNQRLLDFVKNGGTLMVQYIYDTEKFNDGHFAPYPMKLDRNNRDRVVDESAPVTILAPDNPIFKSPNPISLKDFDGWVQERVLYSPTEWDSHYQPMLESKDPDGPEIKGGLLIARNGKGTYIFNSWAFFRQLPAGVPGAIRLYVNLLNAGH